MRVPYADTSLYAMPEGVTDEQAIFLADSLPTGYEVGRARRRRAARVTRSPSSARARSACPRS